MGAINSAYLLTGEQVSPAVPKAGARSFWQRVMSVLSTAGLAALLVG
jgi:hypothetical protein